MKCQTDLNQFNALLSYTKMYKMTHQGAIFYVWIFEK